jgi:hypothetical protein
VKRFLGSLASVAFVACLAPSAVRATDVPYAIFIDGRPVDANTPSGLSHRGVVFVDVVRAVKTFDGLLTFGTGGLVRVTIGGRTLDFRVGTRYALAGTTRVGLPGAPFVENGDTFVPLATIARLASAKVSIDTKAHRYMLSLPEPPPPTPTPVPTSASDDVLPSAAQALAIATFGRADAAGLHVRADVTNETAGTYSVAFPGPGQIEFVVSKNGTEVWNSGSRPEAVGDTRPSTLVLPARGSRSFTAVWTGYAAAGPGRYTLRVRLLTAAPLDESPISLEVATASPQ